LFGSVGAPELIAIFILALVLFGPKKLPELGRTLGKTLAEFRRASQELKTSLERELADSENSTPTRVPPAESVARAPGEEDLADGTKGGTGSF
jgi:TatA/E family protein of Tat protein translocase